MTNINEHVSYDCIYHIVIVPKYRKKILYGQVHRTVWKFIRVICERIWVEIVEWNLQQDHIHMILKIPPKYSVSKVLWTIKWKTAIMLHNEFSKSKKNIVQKSFWSRWYFVRTVWVDKDIVIKYVKEQNENEIKYEWKQMDFGW